MCERERQEEKNQGRKEICHKEITGNGIIPKKGTSIHSPEDIKSNTGPPKKRFYSHWTAQKEEFRQDPTRKPKPTKKMHKMQHMILKRFPRHQKVLSRKVDGISSLLNLFKGGKSRFTFGFFLLRKTGNVLLKKITSLEIGQSRQAELLVLNIYGSLDIEDCLRSSPRKSRSTSDELVRFSGVFIGTMRHHQKAISPSKGAIFSVRCSQMCILHCSGGFKAHEYLIPCIASSTPWFLKNVNNNYLGLYKITTFLKLLYSHISMILFDIWDCYINYVEIFYNESLKKIRVITNMQRNYSLMIKKDYEYYYGANWSILTTWGISGMEASLKPLHFYHMAKVENNKLQKQPVLEAFQKLFLAHPLDFKLFFLLTGIPNSFHLWRYCAFLNILRVRYFLLSKFYFFKGLGLQPPRIGSATPKNWIFDPQELDLQPPNAATNIWGSRRCRLVVSSTSRNQKTCSASFWGSHLQFRILEWGLRLQ
ncbi:hypothetical protein VP01_1799g1 [Puccinia sorghi]|uniref:Uncharacterized protein n=1 Tax=Puccinia sorghi TaxID=27349 RepID=A0A0L6VEE2_9BASI|nr:hypothetical protein VP01_1799g1 [Puccinia sorghi]